MAAAVLAPSSCGRKTGEEPPAEPTPFSLVTLGDSVASGEGINYGYHYHYNEDLHYLSRWEGGTDNPTWEPPYPLCHQSRLAYSDLVAERLDATLASFACTGASYDNGIIAERAYGGQIYRPAEFGDWATQTNLNPQYDQAKPDVVLLTLGADDVDFVAIVEYCAGLGSTVEERSLAAAEDPRAAAREQLLPVLRRLAEEPKERIPELESSYCTQANPGETIQKLFWDRLPQIEQNFQSLVTAIQERGRKDGKVPHIVWTTYYDPLPQPDQSDWCLDVADLERDELDYLISLLETLNQRIRKAVGGMKGVSIADISQVMAGHEWCTEEPWAYGASVLLLNVDSQAPFHPTPEGQQAIARVVLDAVDAAHGGG